MASSTSKHNHLLSTLYGGATSAPPPTPSASASTSTSSVDDAASLSLSRLLLHRLPPPTLSLPARRSSAPATSPPILSLSADHTPSHDLLSSVSNLGFFQLTHHSLSPQLAHSAESESLSLFDLSSHHKKSFFPKEWPLGYECCDDDDDGDGDDDGGLGESFRLDASCSTESTELSFSSLREFTRGLQKLGLDIVDLLSKSMGFENPVGDDPDRFCSIMWISECVASSARPVVSGGVYPFIVGLQYQIRSQKYSLLSDSGWVSVLPHVDSVLVTIGDIAQVWSNGKLKKVRGRAVGGVGDSENGRRSITMTLLVTLPTESRVAPILPKLPEPKEHKHEEDEEREEGEILGEKRVFQSFDFEDYAWRVYHERLHFKDPLDRYRIT
ncbi:gibberellin 2-beta-dioxygenase 1 [Senna tora]|uniref:Gibberellin 2-beta-dioxygenase 1 n=1 Tax=Senna tora TaxID=362788 RepID=A0A834TZH0_9FABA|nr:gibberellin 2-beta-dioxygenase 1 [Senna tora]